LKPAVNEEIERLRYSAEKLAGEIQAIRGGAGWLVLKKEIAQLAIALNPKR
jgi:hypothetical protein